MIDTNKHENKKENDNDREPRTSTSKELKGKKL